MKAPLAFLVACAVLGGCDRSTPEQSPRASGAPAASSAPAAAPFSPAKVEIKDTAMGTALHFIAYTSPRADEPATRKAIAAAIAEMRRLEALMSEWKSDSEIGRVNQRPGEWQKVSAETYDVLEKSLWAGKLSRATFDITFQVMSSLWKFGSAQDAQPRPPSAAEV